MVEKTKGISVYAKMPGFYEGHRRVGDKFDYFPETPPKTLADFPRWMKPEKWLLGSDDEDNMLTAAQIAALADALGALDPKNAGHWIKNGKPNTEVLEKACGFDVSRAMVDGFAPFVTRDAAVKAAEEKKAEAVKAAIAALDPDDDAHWTQDGKPDCNVLKEKCGFAVMREDLEAIAPEATRVAAGNTRTD